MYLKQLILNHFRSYTKASFTLDPKLTIIVGPNAIGKSNLVEAVGLLSTGKSFRTSKEKQLIQFDQPIARVTGLITSSPSLRATEERGNLSSDEIASSSMTPRNDESVSREDASKGVYTDFDTEKIEIVIAENPNGWLQKRYLINGISKRRSSLQGKLPVVLFSPEDLDLVSGQPGVKRRFLDEVLEQSDVHYSAAMSTYSKALKQRNALLEYVQETGRRDRERFAYWDDILIKHGSYIHDQRAELIDAINNVDKELFPFTLTYDYSIISEERLAQYEQAEIGAGVTLVGPQRDDVQIHTKHPTSGEMEDVKYFCSRGQQRLITLELKKAQIYCLNASLGQQPLLVLDDIFSELDSGHIKHVLQMTTNYQTIITTTHKEFVDGQLEGKGSVVELSSNKDIEK